MSSINSKYMNLYYDKKSGYYSGYILQLSKEVCVRYYHDGKIEFNLSALGLEKYNQLGWSKWKF